MVSDKDVVHKFMTMANRPYSGNDVFSNLQRQGIGKSAVDKALDQLVKEKKLFMKLNGKQKIYCVVQPDSTAVDQKEIQSIDEELLATNEALRQIKRKYKESEVEVKALQSTYSTEEAARTLAEMEKNITELKMQIAQLTEIHGNVPEKDKEQVKKDFEKVTKEYKKRKRLCTDVLDSILENCPKTKKVLFEEIGIETDENVGMPSLWVRVVLYIYIYGVFKLFTRDIMIPAMLMRIFGPLSSLYLRSTPFQKDTKYLFICTLSPPCNLCKYINIFIVNC